jgi:hypothetical protein
MTYALNLKSPARRIFTLVIVSFVGLAIYFISQHYVSTLQEAQNLTLERLYNLAGTIALQIDGEEHDKMMQLHKGKDDISYKNSDIIYDKIHNTLKNNLFTLLFTTQRQTLFCLEPPPPSNLISDININCPQLSSLKTEKKVVS